MNQQMGLTEFFAMEASDYLERLDRLVSGAKGPDRDELVRLARALRGSALMANQQSIGTVAAALEGLARAVKEDRVEWDEATRQRTIGAVDGLKILVRSVASWGERETTRAKQIAAELAASAGLPVTDPTPLSESSIDSGTRAFVAREGATVASVLNSTAKAVQREGASANQLKVVIKSMEPLRGLAALSDLSPLPEYLDGVERAVAAFAQDMTDKHEWALFLDVAARGISKAAQEISTAGTAEPESIEAREFTQRLAKLLDIDAQIVPIQSLYFEDEGPHVVEAGNPPAVSTRMQQTELVAQGEHLCQVADGLERAVWDTQRKIRIISLKSTLHNLASARGGALADAVSAFATAGNEALSTGEDLHYDAGFVPLLRDAGTTLSAGMQSDEATLVAALTRITAALRGQPQPSEPVVAGTAAQQELVAEIPEALPAPTSVAAEPVLVPVEQIPTPAAPEIDVAEDTIDLAAGWATFEELRTQLGDGTPSIDLLVSGRSREVETAVAATTPEAPEPDAEIVSITDLCFSGSAALAEAHSVRNRIRTELTAGDWDPALVTDLIDELLDLVELGVGQT